MKVTVCELHNDSELLRRDWNLLTDHVQSEKSEIVLLPEMPFYSWIAWEKKFDPQIWQAAIDAHNDWHKKLTNLSPALVIGTRPVNNNGKRLNEGFIWDAGNGYQSVHHKYYLPDENCFWEASWYGRGNLNFKSFQSKKVKFGMMICTEMWFTEHARTFAKDGVHILVSPRATDVSTIDKWLAGGRAAAVMSGAYCISSNRCGIDHNGMPWAGNGWIIDPDGKILATTSEKEPNITLDIELEIAENAKTTYPRYVLE